MSHALNITTSRFNRRSLMRGVLAVAAASASPLRFAHAAPAVSNKGAKVMLSEAAVADLQKSIKGNVILPESPDYERARKVWAPWIDRRPALIAKVTSTADIQASLQFAKSHDLLTAIRCGGHSNAGNGMCDGGMVIDLTAFNGVEVDPAKKIARVSGGALLGNLDRASAPHKLATTAGVVSHTGVGGLATGAGQGRLARMFGLTIDNNLGVEMALLDGRIVKANAKENPDLYWAIRGGGGNFGIVTQFEFQLHDYDGVITTFSYTYPAAKAKDVMKLYLDMNDAMPPQMTLGAGVRTSERGETTASFSGTYIGPKDAAERLLAPLKALGTPINTRVDQMEYVKLQSIADGSLLSDRFAYNKGGFFSKVDIKLCEAMVDFQTRTNVPRTGARFGQQGGAISKVAETATAFAQRDGIHQVSLDVDWMANAGYDVAGGIKYIRDLWAMMEPQSTHGFYLNTINDDENPDRIRTTYRGNYARLQAIKAKYDPSNFLHLNPNIKPKTAVTKADTKAAMAQ